jgi:hypothetical protein
LVIGQRVLSGVQPKDIRGCKEQRVQNKIRPDGIFRRGVFYFTGEREELFFLLGDNGEAFEQLNLGKVADEGLGILHKGSRDVVGFLVDVRVCQVRGFLGHVGQFGADVGDGVFGTLGALESDASVNVGGEGKLDGGLTGGKGFLLVHLGDDAGVAALQVAEGIGTDAQLGILGSKALLDLRSQHVAKGAGAAELHVAVGVDFVGGGVFVEDHLAIFVADAFGNGDDAAAEFGVNFIDVLDELLHVEGAFGDIDEVRAVVFVGAAKNGRGGEEAGVASHDDVDLDALKRAVVEVIAHEGLRDELGGGTKAGAVVGNFQVVVDGFGDVEAAEFVPFLLGHFVDDVRGLSGIVAADVEEVTHVVFLEDLKNFTAVVCCGFVADGAERGRGGFGNGFERLDAFFAEVDEVFFHHAVNTVASAEDFGNGFAGAERKNGSDEALVDDAGGSAGLSDDGCAFDGGQFLGHEGEISLGRTAAHSRALNPVVWNVDCMVRGGKPRARLIQN